MPVAASATLLAVMGLGCGSLFPVTTVSLQNAVHPHQLGTATAALNFFRQLGGAILVTVDSDSLVEPETLLAIAGPFRDPGVGAVAGKVAVQNRHDGLIPEPDARMGKHLLWSADTIDELLARGGTDH